jgi:hypothetical protein
MRKTNVLRRHFRLAARGRSIQMGHEGHPLPLAKFNLEGYPWGRGEGILSVSEEEEIAEVVRKHGWYAASVYDHEPPFLYSIGLMQSYDHPEFIIFGLETKDAHAILSVTIGAICAGASFRESGVHSGILEGDACVGIRRVHPTQHLLYLGYAMGYCRHLGRIGELEAVQVFWPDKNGKFPFDVGCDLDVYQRQPRLDLPLPPSEVREFRRQWE